jgi:hypothetical protein
MSVSPILASQPILLFSPSTVYADLVPYGGRRVGHSEQFRSLLVSAARKCEPARPISGCGQHHVLHRMHLVSYGYLLRRFPDLKAFFAGVTYLD